MPQIFNNFFHAVEGNEAERCHYPTRLDTYGCGCQHNCGYCYARALLAFRGMWNPQSPSKAPFREIVKVVRKLRRGSVIRLGGMTDCFQPMEASAKNTLRTIELLNRRGIHYLIVTKNDIVVRPEYLAVMDKALAHIQVSITSTDAATSKILEPGAPVPQSRIAAVETLQAEGFDVSVRLSPFIPEIVNLETIRAIHCDKILVEFLRVNTWIEKWVRGTGLPIDLKPYTEYHSGYKHLPLAMKKDFISKIADAFPQVSVCEDVPAHWTFWKDNFNANPDDCCNLKLK